MPMGSRRHKRGAPGWPPRFLLLALDAAVPARESLQRLQRLAPALEAQVELEVAYPADAGATTLSAVAREVVEARLRLTRVVLMPVGPAGSADLAADLAAARASFGDVRIDMAAGARAHASPEAARDRADIDAAIALFSGFAAGARAGAAGVAPCTPDDLLAGHGAGVGATPAFHVFAGMARAAGTTAVELACSDPSGVEMLAHRVNGGLRLWLANPAGAGRGVQLRGVPRGRAVWRTLAADSPEDVAGNVRAFAEGAVPLDLASPVVLAPRSISVVELEFDAGHPIYA